MSGLYGALGLAKRAGKLRAGDYAVKESLAKSRARLVLMDERLSANAAGKLRSMCESGSVCWAVLPEGTIGGAIGKAGCMMAAVEDEAFAKRLSAMAAQESGYQAQQRV